MNFECHITVDVKHAEKAGGFAAAQGWKTSEIARDPLLGEKTYFYLTSHATDYLALHSRMCYVRDWLEHNGIYVIREKIELIMYDVRRYAGTTVDPLVPQSPPYFPNAQT